MFAWRTATWVRSLPCCGVLQGVAGVREAAVGGLVSRAGRVIGSGPRRGRMAEYGRSAHSDARFVTMGEAWCGRPGVPVIFPGEAEQLAGSCRTRGSACKTSLSRVRRRCVAAASLLRFRDAELQRGNAGPCRHRRLWKQGAHVGVAFSGCALGVFSLDSARRTRQRRARKADGRLRQVRRGGLPANPPVCDREGDMWSLLSGGLRRRARRLLVRASRSGGPSRRTARPGTCSRPNWTSSRRRRSTSPPVAAPGRARGATSCGPISSRPGHGPTHHARGARPGEDAADRTGWLLLTTEGEPTQENAIRAWKRWLRVVRGRQDRNADQGAQRRRRPEEVPRLPLPHAPSSSRGGRRARSSTRSMSSPSTYRTTAGNAAHPTRIRRSRSSPSTPRASPDSSRRSASPCRVLTNSGKDT